MRSVLFLALALSLSLITNAAAQTSAPKDAKPKTQTTQIMESLGKLRVDEVKKNAPGGAETRLKPDRGSRLEKLQAETRYTQADGKTAYYFNRRGVLVSVATAATKPLTKDELLRQVKGLEFKKYPPKDNSAAFVKIAPNVLQGFYLAPDGKTVTMTTYDYLGR